MRDGINIARYAIKLKSLATGREHETYGARNVAVIETLGEEALRYVRRIANIHDLSVLRFPEFHPVERVEYMTRHLADTVERASRLVTGSEIIRAEIIDRLGVAPERIVTIHDGVGPAFRPMATAELMPVLSRHGLAAGSYLLAVGTLEPRKNLAALLGAYEGLPAQLRTRFPLVVAGGKGWRDEALLDHLKSLAARGVVRTLGYVPAADLPALYAGARGFAFPSIYEGFGLPALEAAASGVPVLSARNTPMEEVLGEHALLVEPRDPVALRQGLQQLLEDETLGPAARAAAEGFRTRFAWERCIEQTIALYEEVLGSG